MSTYLHNWKNNTHTHTHTHENIFGSPFYHSSFPHILILTSDNSLYPFIPLRRFYFYLFDAVLTFLHTPSSPSRLPPINNLLPRRAHQRIRLHYLLQARDPP
jgi:hypothetical protein